MFVRGYKNGFVEHFKVIVSRCLDLLSNQRLNEYFIEKVSQYECSLFLNISLLVYIRSVTNHVFLSYYFLASVIMWTLCAVYTLHNSDK